MRKLETELCQSLLCTHIQPLSQPNLRRTLNPYSVNLKLGHDTWEWIIMFRFSTYEACPESNDTSHVGQKGNFLCLLWQHCRWPWSFTCEPCSFDSGRTGFVWVRRVWNGSADPKSRQMWGAFRHTAYTSGVPRNFFRGEFNKFSWGQRAERTGIWGW